MAAWVSPPLIVVTWHPLHPFSLLFLPLKTCPIHKNALALAVVQSGSAAAEQRGTSRIPLVRGIKVPSRHSEPGRRAHKQAHRLWMKPPKWSSGVEASWVRSQLQISPKTTQCVRIYMHHTHAHAYISLSVCVCVHVVVPSRKTLTSGACQRSQGLCSHY